MSIEIDTELERILNAYSDDVKEVLKNSVDEIAKATVKDLKETSPKRRKRGGYAKTWAQRENKSDKLNYSRIVYNKKNYRLTHLLERGHLTRDGIKRTRAIPHIAPAEEKAINNFLEKVKNNIEKL